MAVKLAPPPRLQFLDSSGNPYSGAKLFSYAAGTSTKQNTYTTSVGDTANTNPIVLDSSGRTPYGVWLTEGVNYKFVLAPASDTDPPASPIFTEDVITGVNDNSDATNQWAASGVTPTYVSATQFTVPGDKTSTFPVDRRVKCTVTAGTVYGYVSVVAYTTLTTVTVVLDSGSLDSGLSAVQVGILTDLNSALPLTVAKRNAANNYTNAQNEAKGADIASAATINLTTATGNLVHVTGTTTITAITLASGAERTVVFDGSLTLTHNATTLILPDAANIQTAAGDKAVFRGDGSGNTRCISYERAVRKGSDVASAATVNLDAATGDLIHITGTTTITAITLASGRECTVVFDGILTLTHNATTLICPGGANITTAAGDRAILRGDGSGNTRVISYIPATGHPKNMAKGSDVASAATVNLDTATGDFVHITGTTTITAITLASGKEATVVFDGALTLTHNATTLILPGGQNITTAAGDRATFRGDGSGNTRCIHYTKANGQAVIATDITSVTNITSATTLTSANIAYHTVAMTAIGVSVTLPDATTMTVGAPKALFKNTGGYPFGVRDNSGTLLMAVAPGGVAWVSCDSTSTAAGSWSIEGTNLEPGLITIDSTFSSTYASTVLKPFVALDDNKSIHFAALANGFAAFAVDKTTGAVGTPLTITTTASSVPKHCFKITSTTAIVFYGENANTLRAAVISLSGDTTLAVGTAATLSATGAAVEDFSGAPKIAQLDSTHYIVSYATATGAGTTSVAALEVASGTTVTWGSPANIIAANNVQDSTTTYALTATTALVFYTSGAAAPFTVSAVVVSVSGTTCTVGTPAAASTSHNGTSGDGRPPANCLLSATKALVLDDNNTATTVRAIAVTISGTTVTAGSPLTVESSVTSNTYIARWDARSSGVVVTRFTPKLSPIGANSALLWYDDGNAVSRTVVLSESGGTVTAGTILYTSISRAASGSNGFGAIIPQGTSEFCSIMQELATTAGVGLRLAAHKISGTAITQGQTKPLRSIAQAVPTAIFATRLSQGDYIVVSGASDGSAAIAVARSNGDAINYRGDISTPALLASSYPVQSVASNRIVLLSPARFGTTVGTATYQLRLLNIEVAA